MKTFTVFRRFSVEIQREIEAENFGDAEQKARALKFEKFVKVVPGAELLDWEDLPGMTICEERD